jgi:sRNA-binding carbon storage regulator CsrA
MDLYDIKYNESMILELGGVKVTITLLPSKDCPGEYAFGIEAPKSIAINREEIYKKLNQHKEK